MLLKMQFVFSRNLLRELVIFKVSHLEISGHVATFFSSDFFFMIITSIRDTMERVTR